MATRFNLRHNPRGVAVFRKALGTKASQHSNPNPFELADHALVERKHNLFFQERNPALRSRTQKTNVDLVCRIL